MTRPERDVTVLWAAESDFLTEDGIKAHSHDYYHIFYVLRGPLEFQLDGRGLSLAEGECLIARPGVSHSLRNHSNSEGICWEFKLTVHNPKLAAAAASLPERFQADELVRILLSEIMEERGCCGAGDSDYASLYGAAVLRSLSRRFGQTADAEFHAVDASSYSEITRRIVRYLEANDHREVPLQEIADQVEFNKNYICSLFKRDAGVTIGGCQMVIRVRRAAELISFSDMSLNQVATATGFTNISHFNRIFKRVVSVPPGQYRRLFTANALTPEDADALLLRAMEDNPLIDSVLNRRLLRPSELLLILSEE